MLRDIEPVAGGLDCSWASRSEAEKSNIPEIEIVDRSLLIPHIDVKGKEVDRG